MHHEYPVRGVTSRKLSEEFLALLLRCLGILDLNSYLGLWLRSRSIGVAGLEGPSFVATPHSRISTAAAHSLHVVLAELSMVSEPILIGFVRL